MKVQVFSSILAVASFLTAIPIPSFASDHADPMTLNVFEVQPDPEANITDLHAFIDGDNLVVSLCARRALRPDQVGGLDLDGYRFRISMDFHPPVRFATNPPPSGSNANNARANQERSQQALYGGIIDKPEDITPEVILEFGMSLVKDPVNGEQSQAKLTHLNIQGVPGSQNIVSEEKIVDGKVAIPANVFAPGQINVQTGVFDDPFIFPRFFRRNVVGVVASIPLKFLPQRNQPVLLWATTHGENGKQIDHVGRSLRTQLPRFGYLNVVSPAGHNAAITKVHAEPTIVEDVSRTLIAPLIAHRHYDTFPDVMIYDLSKPARFPNGRAFTDDVAKTLADAGETLLFELSYAESRQFPRATANDKAFRPRFPYLAERWTSDEIKKVAAPGSNVVPVRSPDGSATTTIVDSSDMGAIARPDLTPATWRKLWGGTLIALLVVTAALAWLLRTNAARIATGVVVISTILWMQRIVAKDDLMNMAQPSQRLNALIFGLVVTFLLFLIAIYLAGRKCGQRKACCVVA
jgi:hypothetical protein